MADAARETGSTANGVESWAWPTPWIECPDRAQGAAGQGSGASPLFALYFDDGQSPWLDHLTRKDIVSGSLSRMVAAGIRGVTVNPDVLARALEVSPEYAEQLSWLLLTGRTMEEAYWELAATDVQAACAILQPVYEASQAEDGFVSVEVAPGRARRTHSATAAARHLHDRIDRPNLLVGIPATPQGVPALQATVSSGCNTNATSIFSIDRYSAVVDAYLAGLDTFVSHGGDPATVHGVASFCLSPIDAEVDQRLRRLGDNEPRELVGRAGVAQVRRACQLFEERFSSERWQRLARRGANPQRLLWTSSGTDADADHSIGDLLSLIAPNTILALSDSTAMSVAQRGIGGRAHHSAVPEAAAMSSALSALGIDLEEVGLALENQTAALAPRAVTGLGQPTARRRGR